MKRRRIIEIASSAVLIAALIYAADIEKTFKTLSNVKIEYYAAAAGMFMLTYIPSARRWQIISDSINHDISLLNSFRVLAVSYSFNKLLPWNFGDMVRSKISESYHDVESHGNVLGGAGLERVLDAMTITSVIGVSALFTSTGSRISWTVAAIAGIFLGGALLLFSDRASIITRYAPAKAENFLEDAIEGFRSVERADAAEIVAWSQLKWWMEAGMFYLLAISITSTLSFWDAAIVTSVMSIFAALPISPAGIGPGDAAATGLLLYAGMGYSAALSLVLLQRSIGVGIQGAVGALIYSLNL